jgi:hypothetical protein
MEFWWGLIVGAIAGANIGVVLAGLLAGSKREEKSQDYLWDQLQMDHAVMDETPDKNPQAASHLRSASADPAPNF